MAIVTNTLEYLDGDLPLQGFVAYDDAIEGQRPAVLISHAWGGRDDFVANKAIKMAELGYLGFALDMYGQARRGSGPEENAKLMQPFIDDRQLLKRRINAALTAVRTLPWTDEAKIAAMGFCFGGLCVLDLARSGAEIAGVISFHGLLMADNRDETAQIAAKILVLHGHDDPMVPLEQVNDLKKELTEAKVDWQFHTFSQTMHAFTNPLANDPDFGTVYQPRTDKRSWQLLLQFLNEIFNDAD